MKLIIYLIIIILTTTFVFSQRSSIEEIEREYDIALNNLEKDVHIAIISGKKIINQSTEINYKLGIGKGKRIFAKSLHIIANYSEAQNNFLEALQIFESENNKAMIANIYRDLGEFNRALRQYKEALKYLEKSYEISLEIKDTLQLIKCYNRYSAVFFEMFDDKNCEVYIQKSLELSDKIKNISPAILSNIYNIKGVLCFKKGFIDSAFYFGNKAYNLAKNNDFIYEEITNLRNIIHYYNHIGEKEKALELTKSAFNDAAKYQYSRFSIIIASIAGELSYDLGLYKEAADYFNFRFKLLDSVSNPVIVSKIKIENALLQLDKAEKDKIEKENVLKFTFWITISIILFTLLFSFGIFYFLKTKNKLLVDRNIALESKNQIIQEQNEKLFEYNNTKDKFFSIIAHDLKNPVFAINLSSKYLSDNYDIVDEEDKKQLITENYQSSKNLQSLLENLLTWARSQSGLIQSNPDFNSVKSLINMDIMVLTNVAAQKKIKIVNNIESELKGYFDLNQIDTVTRNIISNAIKFSNENCIIEVNELISEDEDFIKFEINDNGIGMTQETKNNLFIIGSSRSNPGTNGEKGTGLGLIICKEFIEKNNGKISVESHIGKGSVFTIELPKNNL